MTTTTLPALIQQFFTDRLCNQMEASPNTIASYRDTFRLPPEIQELHIRRGIIRHAALWVSSWASVAACDSASRNVSKGGIRT